MAIAVGSALAGALPGMASPRQRGEPYRPMDTVGARLRELRRERRLTQEQLAEKAGVSRSYVADLESGQIKRPDTPDNLKLLAAALEVSLPELAAPLGWYDGLPKDDPGQWIIGMRGDPTIGDDGKKIIGEMAVLMRKRAKAKP